MRPEPHPPRPPKKRSAKSEMFCYSLSVFDLHCLLTQGLLIVPPIFWRRDSCSINTVVFDKQKSSNIQIIQIGEAHCTILHAFPIVKNRLLQYGQYWAETEVQFLTETAFSKDNKPRSPWFQTSSEHLTPFQRQFGHDPRIYDCKMILWQ